MTKEERIQEAYGEYWNELNNQSKECAFKNEGWVASILNNPPTDIDIDFESFSYRPKSLQGIEDNNGWVKIEDKQITKFNDSFDIVFTNKGNIYTYATYCNFSSIYELEKVTHFQQITKPQPPIY